MNDPLELAVILGTARDGNYTSRVLPGIADFAAERDWKVTTIEVGDHLQEHTGSAGDAGSLHSRIDQADAVIVITPEYNHSIPGELKLFLDRHEWEYAHKPVGTVTASNSPTGGVRAALALQPILATMRAVVVSPQVLVADVRAERDPFDDERHARLRSMLFDELEFYARPLAEARRAETTED